MISCCKDLPIDPVFIIQLKCCVQTICTVADSGHILFIFQTHFSKMLFSKHTFLKCNFQNLFFLNLFLNFFLNWSTDYPKFVDKLDSELAMGPLDLDYLSEPKFLGVFDVLVQTLWRHVQICAPKIRALKIISNITKLAIYNLS